MQEKPAKLPMDFGEVLARLAQTPKTAVDAISKKTKASKRPPRSGRHKAA